MNETFTENILGYAVYQNGAGKCLDSLMNWMVEGRKCRWLACLNPHSYVVAQNDATFAKALNDADWLVPDGFGVVMASRMLGGMIRERVTGSDVFSGLHQRLNEVGGYSVFFLGATDETLALIERRMNRDYPNVRVAGTYSPPFKTKYSAAEIDEMIKAINGTQPDVLWIGMTAPKQEKWIYENRNRLNVKFAGAVGAVFDFYTGRVKRSHPAFQHMGLEWLPRLVQQPRRLWRRMFVSAPVFIWHVIRYKFRFFRNEPRW